MGMITKDSFTNEGDSLDRLVLAYYSIRIIGCFIYVVFNFPQLYYECKVLKRTNFTLTPRFIVFACLVIQPIMRILSCGFFIRDHDYSGHGLFFIFGNWCIVFIFGGWLFISSFWLQIYYTFFTSEQISWKNKEKVWKISLYMSLVMLVWGIGENLASCLSTTTVAGLVSAAGFILCLVGVGLFLAINLIILSYHLKKHKSLTLVNEKHTRASDKIKKFALCLVGTIILVAARELWLQIAKPSFDDNIRHLSSFFTMLIEYFQMTIVMLGCANRPINYLLFRPVNRSKWLGDSISSHSNPKGFLPSNSSNAWANSNHRSVNTMSYIEDDLDYEEPVFNGNNDNNSNINNTSTSSTSNLFHNNNNNQKRHSEIEMDDRSSQTTFTVKVEHS